ncbi:hypothetical protein KPSA3_01485 [Pseudomonas syringae pv. actinidiae]|uniref:Uncharacterized protein n=1 Tax=Pseudomonas syringae pv. actinidiae TaxID=103796 RepID=A0AAN4TJR0_PSESF|nr:hypothetical protein KPSA3_01485 [Pseudomonas syringae pv. actinidiae]
MPYPQRCNIQKRRRAAIGHFNALTLPPRNVSLNPVPGLSI